MGYIYKASASRGKSLLFRFVEKYETNTNGCWIWQGAKQPRGYGLFNNESAHRASYKLFIGEIPPKKVVCHKCDNPSCVSPFHLFLGSQQENIKDAQVKGRWRYAPHPSHNHYKIGCRCAECLNCAREYNLKHKERINEYRLKYHKKRREAKDYNYLL